MNPLEHNECCHHASDKNKKSCEHTASLGHILNCLYALKEETQWAHWTVSGPYFESWHKLYGQHYEQLTNLLDDFVEHLLMHHHGKTLHLCSQTQHRELKQTNHQDSLKQMENLYRHSEEIQNHIRSLFQSALCPSLIDLLTEGLRTLEKQNWFYKSSLST